jgi:hypothetical protein
MRPSRLPKGSFTPKTFSYQFVEVADRVDRRSQSKWTTTAVAEIPQGTHEATGAYRKVSDRQNQRCHEKKLLL